MVHQMSCLSMAHRMSRTRMSCRIYFPRTRTRKQSLVKTSADRHRVSISLSAIHFLVRILVCLSVYLLWSLCLSACRLSLVCRWYSQSHLGWHFRKLEAQSSNVSFAMFQWKETFELWALSFETAFKNVTPSGIGYTSDVLYSDVTCQSTSLSAFFLVFPSICCMGWLRLVGSIKFKVSFAEYSLFYGALSQKRPIILSILLTKASP